MSIERHDGPTASGDTTASAAPARSGAGLRVVPLAIAAVLGLAGARLLPLGTRPAITGGVLLLTGALVAAGVALGAGRWGPGSEAAPDLSTRLGLGWLGGLLAGLLHGVLTVAAGWLGVAALLGAGIDVDLTALEWWGRAFEGGLWGLVLGALYPVLPGDTFVGRGATFGLLLALWRLFYVYPFQLGLGMAGSAAGPGIVPLVTLGAVVAAIVAAWFVAWGGRPRDEPLSAPLVG